MRAKAITGVETTSTQRRVRDVMQQLSQPRDSGHYGRPARQRPTLPWLEPLYGIHGTTVDAKLEIEGAWAGRGRPDRTQVHSGSYRLPRPYRDGAEVTIQREVIRAMVHDDEVAESRKDVGVGHRPTMDGVDRRPVRGGDSTPFRTAEPPSRLALCSN